MTNSLWPHITNIMAVVAFDYTVATTNPILTQWEGDPCYTVKQMTRVRKLYEVVDVWLPWGIESGTNRLEFGWHPLGVVTNWIEYPPCD